MRYSKLRIADLIHCIILSLQLSNFAEIHQSITVDINSQNNLSVLHPDDCCLY
jgi:hypothetical protein